MNGQALKFGDSLAGLLLDGIFETPFVAATLKYDQVEGVYLEIPYIHHLNIDQFATTNEWFESQRPPQNMVLKTLEGDICLYGTHFRSRTSKLGRGISVGRIDVDDTVLRTRSGPLGDSLAVSELRSRVDGLSEWTQFNAVDWAFAPIEKEGIAPKVVITLQSTEQIEWQHGTATMSFQTEWATEKTIIGMNANQWVTLTSRFADSRSVNDHVLAQRQVTHLLGLMFGQPIRFRKHHVRDASLVEHQTSGQLSPSYELISWATLQDFSEPVPTTKDLSHPIGDLKALGSEGMARWAEQYEKYERVVLPTIGLLNRAGASVEDAVISTSMSLEAAGTIIGKREGERDSYSKGGNVATATYFYRCLHALELPWDEVAESIAGLSIAIANTYNDIKHYGRGKVPERTHSYLVGLVGLLTVRLTLANVVDPTGTLVASFGASKHFMEIKNEFEERDVFITKSGSFRDYPVSDIQM